VSSVILTFPVSDSATEVTLDASVDVLPDVAQGFTQPYGTDFQETFAPAARLSSFHAVIAPAALEVNFTKWMSSPPS